VFDAVEHSRFGGRLQVSAASLSPSHSLTHSRSPPLSLSLSLALSLSLSLSADSAAGSKFRELAGKLPAVAFARMEVEGLLDDLGREGVRFAQVSVWGLGFRFRLDDLGREGARFAQVSV